MPDLNRSERRALLLATTLVLLGAAARLGLGPGEEAYGWRPAATGGPTAGALEEVREAVERGRTRARRASTPLAPGERLDPNTAPAVELERLPGVGPVTAGAILRHRSDRPFRRRRDLLAVHGIGPATLAKIAAHLDLPEGPVVGGASGAAGAAAATGGTESGVGRPGPGRGRARPGGGEGLGGRLDLNRATREELRALPGVGPFLARQILAHRDREGGFEDVDELLDVWGIGAARLEEIRPLVVVR